MARSCETQPRPEYMDAYREIQIIKESMTLFVQDMLFASDHRSVCVCVCVHMAMMVMVTIVSVCSTTLFPML